MRAVVLALPVEGADPRDRLAGLGLAQRTVLTLQKEGFEPIVLVAHDAEALASELRDDPRTKVELIPSLPIAIREHLENEPVLVAKSEVVVDPAIYRVLRDTVLEGPLAVAATRDDHPMGPFLADPRFFDGSAPDRHLEDALASGEARKLEVRGFFARVDDEKGRALAFRELFEACRKPVDGIVSRHLNRHVSIFISKRIVDTSITPNAMSGVTFLLGVAAAICVAQGTYWSIVIGAFLLQWNSILDGVDGELARVRFQHSKLGQWIDTLSDDVTNVIFWSALGVGARSWPHGGFLSVCGYVTAIANGLVAAIYYVEMIKLGSGDMYAIEWSVDKEPPRGLVGKLLVAARYALKKDFFILFCFVLALFGVLPYSLPVLAAFACGLLVAAIGRAIKRAATPATSG